jgi:arylsulfatase A-like enzyme
VDPAAAAAAGFAPFDRGPFDHGLSRLLGGAATTPAGSFWAAVYRSPFVDEHLARVARAAIEAEDLGGDEWPDLLGLSFSALDTVGHEYGPASLEVLDTLLRLDRSLGELFDLLDRRLGRGSWTVALSADHGVADVPEVAAEVAGRGHRWGIPEVSCMRRSGAAVAARYGAGVWLASGYLDRPEIARRGLDLDEVTEAAAVELEGCPGVAAVWTRGRLTGDLPAGADPEMRDLYRAAWHPERSPDLLLQVAAGDVTVPGTNTTHGSPWDYDRHVPLVLAGAGVVPGRVERPVRTVDLAPTLARLLGVDPPAGIDGRVLPEVASAVAPAEAASGRP